MADISFELLEILDSIDRRGSFAGAAQELNRVPSALSYSIQKSEAELGVTLFVRQGRRSVFTPAGRHLLESGRELLTAADRLCSDTKTLASGWEPRINIALDALVPAGRIMELLSEFLASHPEVEIDVSEEVLGGAWEALIDDRVNLVVGAPAPVPGGKGIRAEPLGVVERVFAVRHDHPLAAVSQPLKEEDLAHSRMVIVHDSTRKAIPRATRLLNPSKHFYVQTIGQKLEAQRAGIGGGFLPRRMVEPFLASGEMVALTVAGIDLEDHLYLAWKTVNRGRGIRALVESLKAADINL